MWLTVFGIGFGFWCLQVATIITLSFLFLSDPIPNTLGTCGSPRYPPNNSTMLVPFIKSQFTRLFNQASMRYANCVDDGKSVTCPGPIGQTFSWQVVESEPSYCWFGPRYCFEGSRTITQQATLVPRDMGTIRKSQMSMTVMVECSHLNTTEFVKVGYNSIGNFVYWVYRIGTTNDTVGFPETDNYTLLVKDSEIATNDNYRLTYKIFNVLDRLFWSPPDFLADNLSLPFLTDNNTASSSLYLIFNRLFSVRTSVFPNKDPFFLTETEPKDGYYPYGRRVGTLVCRDRLRLQIEPEKSSDRPWIATGTFGDIYKEYQIYRNVSHITPLRRLYLDGDIDLFVRSLHPAPLYRALEGLSGNILYAQVTVLANTQFGFPQNVSTRSEVTRWFGVSMLYSLYMADILTSGTDNDLGFGIIPFRDAWFCDNTLRVTPGYSSLKFLDLCLMLLMEMLIILFSYTLVPMLKLYANNLNMRESESIQNIRESLSSLAQHNVLQQHRIAVENTTDQRLHSIPYRVFLVKTREEHPRTSLEHASL